MEVRCPHEDEGAVRLLDMPTEILVMMGDRWLHAKDLLNLSATCRRMRRLIMQHCLVPFFVLPRERWTYVCRLLRVEDVARLGATCRVMRSWVARYCARGLPAVQLEGHLTKQGGLVKNWTRRWFVLKEGNLSAFTTSSEVGSF